jgi:SOS response regulatory protein OraA/RecX
MIEAFLKRKFRNVKMAEYLAEEKHLASAYRKLIYSGFSSSNAIKVLKRYAERAEDLEDSELES